MGCTVCNWHLAAGASCPICIAFVYEPMVKIDDCERKSRMVWQKPLK